MERIARGELYITRCIYDELKEITKEVREKDAIENIIYQKASPAVAINCGPGTFGMLFAKMDDE